jgi:hypothetical protein
MPSGHTKALLPAYAIVRQHGVQWEIKSAVALDRAPIARGGATCIVEPIFHMNDTDAGCANKFCCARNQRGDRTYMHALERWSVIVIALILACILTAGLSTHWFGAA